MQTDLRVLLLTIGIVMGCYLLFHAIKGRRRKIDLMEQEEFEPSTTATVHQNTKKDNDPLMEDQFNLHTTARPVSKKQMIDDSLEHHFKYSNHHNDYSEMVAHSAPQKDSTESTEPMDSSATQDFIALTVMAKDHHGFDGAHLLKTINANHFHYSKQKVFHRHIHDNPSQATMFSLLSLINPGSFELTEMGNKSYPGIVLLMVLSEVSNPSAIFEKMLTNARQLAVMLEGEICDFERKPLTAHTMTRLRENIQQSQHRKLTQG